MSAVTVSPFGMTLRRLREDRGLSRTKLARKAACDHSYVGRLECGYRQPSRQTVNELSVALTCTEAEQDALLLAAGFTRRAPRVADANLLLLDEALQDDRLPESYRRSVRDAIDALLRGCEAVKERPAVKVVRREW